MNEIDFKDHNYIYRYIHEQCERLKTDMFFELISDQDLVNLFHATRSMVESGCERVTFNDAVEREYQDFRLVVKNSFEQSIISSKSILSTLETKMLQHRSIRRFDLHMLNDLDDFMKEHGHIN